MHYGIPNMLAFRWCILYETRAKYHVLNNSPRHLVELVSLALGTKVEVPIFYKWSIWDPKLIKENHKILMSKQINTSTRRLIKLLSLWNFVMVWLNFDQLKSSFTFSQECCMAPLEANSFQHQLVLNWLSILTNELCFLLCLKSHH